MNRDLASWLIEYLLNSIWQVPLIFAAAVFASRLARPSGTAVLHRIWSGAVVIAAILPLCNLSLREMWQEALAFVLSAWPRHSSGGNVRIILSGASAHAPGLHLPPGLVTGIIFLYASILTYFAIRLAYGLCRTRQIRQQSHPIIHAGEVAARFDHFSRLLHFGNGQLAVSTTVQGPVTVGIRRPTLLLPSGFLASLLENDSLNDLDTVLAHELAHMKRHDFAKNLLYELLSLPLSFHPVLWLIRSRLAETREMVCDEAAAEAIAGHDRYARSLLRLAAMLSTAAPERNLQAIGIFDANNFERRVMHLTRNRPTIHRTQKVLIAVACTAIAFATGASAIALHTEISAAQSPSEASKKIHVKADDLKLLTQVRPVYPPSAKSAGIQGAVVLEVLIGKDGVPGNIKIQKGPKELQQSALDAVRQWRYQPYLLNGDPIEVETTVTVAYALGG